MAARSGRSRWTTVASLAVLVAIVVAGCGRSTGSGERMTPPATSVVALHPGSSPRPVRTFAVWRPPDGERLACPAYAVEPAVRGTLAGDPIDPELIWLIGPAGRISVSWPAGFTVAFGPDVLLFDGEGRLFARAGDTVRLGQIRLGSHAGTPADPYIAAGAIDATGPNGATIGVACAPAADGTPYGSPAPSPSTEPSSASAAASSSPSPTLSADATTALDLATHYETARAAGRWSEAWALLSAQSQATIGSLATFEANERAYNAAGGTAFEVRDPTRDPDLVANVLGTDEARIAEVADTSRGWLVFIGHADVKGASAGSEGLYLAPLPSGEWRIWIVH